MMGRKATSRAGMLLAALSAMSACSSNSNLDDETRARNMPRSHSTQGQAQPIATPHTPLGTGQNSNVQASESQAEKVATQNIEASAQGTKATGGSTSISPVSNNASGDVPAISGQSPVTNTTPAPTNATPSSNSLAVTVSRDQCVADTQLLLSHGGVQERLCVVVAEKHQLRCFGQQFLGDNNYSAGKGARLVLNSSRTPIENVIASAGATVSGCAVADGGKMQCWGSDPAKLGAQVSGQDNVVASATPFSTGVIAAAGGYFHTCALTEIAGIRSVQCFGDNESGQLGNNSTTGSPSPVTVQFSTGDVPMSLSVGKLHGCASLSTGKVKCWGANDFGQIGSGNKSQLTYLIPTEVKNVTDAVAVEVGHFHSCALLKSGAVQCWGGNSQIGQLGIGLNNADKTGTSDFAEAGKFAISSGAIAIASGKYHTCALMSDANVQCWGRFSEDASKSSLVPKLIPEFSGAVAVSGGKDLACAILKGGAVKCFGDTDVLRWGAQSDEHDAWKVQTIMDEKGAAVVALDSAPRCKK